MGSSEKIDFVVSKTEINSLTFAIVVTDGKIRESMDTLGSSVALKSSREISGPLTGKTI